MKKQISRRDFLKLAGTGAATTAVLTGCGTASRLVTREPYTKMPEYTYNGLSTYYATTCRECSAGCGLIVRTMQGRAIKTEGNPDNPVNLGKTCARGQATLHGLYNPNRVRGPIQHSRGQSLYDANQQDMDSNMSWDDAVQVVSKALSGNKPDEIAFLLGMAPDHIYDLVTDLTKAVGGPAPVRFGALGMFESRATLMKAAEDLLGQSGLPFFDIGNAHMVFSFGSNFLETWLSPVAQTRQYSQLRSRDPQRRGYLVQFEARMSQTGLKADEWYPITPGTEGLVALAIGNLAAQVLGVSMPAAFANVDVKAAAESSGMSMNDLTHLASLFAKSASPLAIPGGSALGQSNGLQAAEAVLALNALVDNFGKEGGLFLSPTAPLTDAYHRPASIKEMTDFVGKLKSGAVKVLFVHGVNPLFELPGSLGFKAALKNVPQVISFATFPDETATEADYIFPDHHPLESWGYQQVATGSGSSVLSGAQPVVVPYYDTRATVDVFLAAAQAAGGDFVKALPFKDELAYIQNKISNLVGAKNGFYYASDINTLAAYFQQHGGWWTTDDKRVAPSSADVLSRAFDGSTAKFEGNGDFYLIPFVSPVMAEAGANKPWLQEVPDPTTTVTWNSWVEINPATADKLGIDNDDMVLIKSNSGSVEVSVYKYPAIRPDTIAIPFGQGHTAYGRYAEQRGVNPADLLAPSLNEAGDLAFAGMKVSIEKTGKKRVLARLESIMGVYGTPQK